MAGRWEYGAGNFRPRKSDGKSGQARSKTKEGLGRGAGPPCFLNEFGGLRPRLSRSYSFRNGSRQVFSSGNCMKRRRRHPCLLPRQAAPFVEGRNRVRPVVIAADRAVRDFQGPAGPAGDHRKAIDSPRRTAVAKSRRVKRPRRSRLALAAPLLDMVMRDQRKARNFAI